MSKILIIDDDDELTDLVSEFLGNEGFEVTAVHDGESGLAAALTNDYELAILDVMLPKKNGFDVLRELRRSSSLPVVMLTAKGDDTERIVGLEIGADDYLPKPFNPRELAARLRAVLRRVQEPEERRVGSDVLRADDVVISLAGRTAMVADRDLGLTAVEFDLLTALVEQAGRVVKKEDLSKRVLDRRLSPFDRSLDMHVSNLRKKLGPRRSGGDRIKTIRSVGYIYTVI